MGSGTDILESAKERAESVAGGPARLQIIAVLAAILLIAASALAYYFLSGAPLLFGALSEWLGGGQNGLMWTFLIMLLPMLVASLLGVKVRRTYLRDVATAAASSRADKS